MPKTKISLAELVKLFRRMESREWRDGRLYGQLRVEDQTEAEQLRDLLSEDNADSYPCLVEKGDPENINVGDVLQLGFGSPRTAVGLVVPSVEKLLQNHEVAAGTAEYSWYVIDDDVASWESGAELCIRLAMVKRLVVAFESSAALFDHRKGMLIFLRNGRFDVPVRYGRSALQKLDMVAAERLVAALEVDDGHSGQRREICSTAVCEMLADINTGDRFSGLLSKIDELYVRFEDGYGLFASSFSFEKIRDQAEAVRIEYTAKIHKTLADIQGQLLGIPISTIVVATQFKEASTTSGQIWVNIAVMVGATIFCALLFIAVWNQRHSLSVISDEVDRHENALKRESTELALKLSGIFNKLRDRIFWHEAALAVIMLVAIVAWMVSFAVFWMLTRSVL